MDKKLRVIVSSEIGSFMKDMDRVSAKAKETAKKTEDAGKQSQSGIGRLADVANRHEEAWGQVSNTMVGAGTLITGGLALSGKAAMDWQSQFAGVRKTIDDTEEGYAELSDGLRDLAKELPSTHAEIAGVAEAAGQLGVARDDVLGFTATMIDLGETTNLTAEDAATNIAQISNVMGTMEREGAQGVERFGSALVALGNDGASTEAEILSMAQRIAGAAASLGASEADVLALSNTLASMGVRAELGGGVATRVLLKMRTAVDEGGESLESFAGVAGTSAEEFASKFSSSPMEALQDVAEGIARTNDAGGNLTETLKDMGIKGTEEMQVMLALANSGDLLTESLELGAKAWEENSALADEAAERYATAESKVKVAWNNIKDAGIDAGAALLPVIAGLAEGIADLAGWFTDLPEPVQISLSALGGIAGVGLLAAGGLMKIVSALGDTIPKMQALGIDTPRATRAVSLLGKTIGGITAVGAGLMIGKEVIEGINEAVRSGRPDVEEYFNILATGGNLSDTLDLDLSADSFVFPSSAVDSLKAYYNTHTEGAAAAKRALEFSGQNGFLQWMGSNLGMGDVRDAADDWIELSKAGEAIAQAFDMGETDLGTDAFKNLKTELELTDENLATLINNVPALKSALTSMATEGGIQIDPNNELGLVDLALGKIRSSAPEASSGLVGAEHALEAIGIAADGSVKSMDDFLDKLFETGIVTRDEREAFRHYQASIDDVTASIKENGKSLDVNTEKGRANQAAFDGLAQSGEGYVRALAASGATEDELQAAMASTYDSLIAAAGQFGITGDAADKMAREVMGIPEDVKVKTWMSDAARKEAEKTKAAADALDGTTAHVWITTHEKSIYSESHVSTGRGGGGGQTVGGYTGGRAGQDFGFNLPGLEGGGRVPRTGLGIDQVLGVDRTGRPTAMVNDDEWVINNKSSDKFNGVLSAINADAPNVQGLAGLAGGGRAGREFSGSFSSSSSSTVNNGPTINMPITINGATDENRVSRRIKDDLTRVFNQNGIRLGL